MRLVFLLANQADQRHDHRDYHIFVARLLTDLLRLSQEIGGVVPYDGTVSLFERLFEIKTIPEIESWFMQVLIV
ncbi:MAG: hypothetical protein J7639_31115, partial [Paenibacillaceae bacterium]|nr:hypothetical protein [Paenibacillaceae bacterium]